MKWLAIDFGERRLGIAVGSTETGMAFPRPWIDTLVEKDIFAALRQFVKDEKPVALLLGMPHRTDGKPSEKALAVQKFAKELEAQIPLPISFRDEAFTSVVAKEKTKHLKTKTKKQEKGRIDSAAACLLLQEHLDEIRKG